VCIETTQNTRRYILTMNLLFDFDGTLCDSFDSILGSLNPALKLTIKKELTKEEIQNEGLLALLKKYNIPLFTIPFLVILVRYRLKKTIPYLKPFPDIQLVLKELASNHTLGIVTTNSVKNVKLFLNNNDLLPYFDFVYSSTNFADKSARIRKALTIHDLKAHETYFIGDETRDINAAKLSNVKTIAVTWGIESEKLLKKTKPNLIISKPKELLSHFR